MEETGPEAGGNMTCPRYKQHETQSNHGATRHCLRQTANDMVSMYCLNDKVNNRL